jgi:hypothetical protein
VNQHQAHVGSLELDLIFFENLNLNGMNTVVLSAFLVLLGFLADVPFLGADITEAVVKIIVGINGIFFQKVMEIPLGVVVGSGKVLGEKDIDGQRFGQGGDNPSTDFRYRVDLVLSEVHSEKQGSTCDIDQDDDNEIDEELHINSRSLFDVHFGIP